MNNDWRKSTYSGGANNQCVECGTTADSVLIRDTADPDSLTLSVSTGMWSEFLGAIK